MRNAPSNGDNIIDSRDVIERIDELESDIEVTFDLWFKDYINECREVEGATVPSEYDQESFRERFNDEHKDEDDQTELKILLALAEEGEQYAADWKYGETLIRDSYFETYARELADDIGAVNKNASWPNNCIDWERAARELQMDYTSVDFDGVTYWVR